MDRTIFEWRCTRDALYQPGSIGHRDFSARQGHYVNASTAERAKEVMARRFPEDVRMGGTFTVTKVGMAYNQTEDEE